MSTVLSTPALALMVSSPSLPRTVNRSAVVTFSRRTSYVRPRTLTGPAAAEQEISARIVGDAVARGEQIAEAVVALLAVLLVGAAAADEDVVAGAGEDDVRLRTANEDVIAVTAADDGRKRDPRQVD